MLNNFLVEFKLWTREFEVVHRDWLFSLMHFKSEANLKIPLLISYA